MTIVAWDGKTLVADKQSYSSGYASVVTKIFRVPGGIVGFCGAASHARQLLNWFMTANRSDETFPVRTDDKMFADALFITDKREVRGYYNSPYYHVYENKFTAMGAGRDYALMAMHLGYDAYQAVKYTNELCLDCGKGIDTLTLEDSLPELEDIQDKGIGL